MPLQVSPLIFSALDYDSYPTVIKIISLHPKLPIGEEKGRINAVLIQVIYLLYIVSLAALPKVTFEYF